MIKFLITLILITSQVFAGLPPTTTKGSGDANPVTTFRIDAPNIPITHSGTTATIGTIPVAGGGTGSTASLNNNRVMQSSGGSIVEAALITGSRLLVSDSNGIPTHSVVTSTEAGYLSGVTGGIQTQLDAKQLRSTLTTKGDLYVATASATTARQGVGSDGQILAADSTKTNGIKWIDPVNADNLIFDGDAEAGITNFVEGSYSAATRPSGTFTASSGAGTFQISTSSSSPLFGANSFLLTKSSGASRQGRAIERTINLDSGYQTKMLKTRIDYTIVSGSFVAGSNGSSPTDSSLIWYVGQYNGSTWSYTEPSTFKMFSNSTTNKDWVEGEFQVNADTTQLKLIGFISESANSAWVVKAEVGFRLSAYLAGTPITDWVSYTPTFTGFGTATNIEFYSRRVGDSLQLRGKFTSGTSTATEARVSLGYGTATLTAADTSKLATIARVGSWSRDAYTNLFGLSVLAEPSVGYITFGLATGSVDAISKQNGNGFISSGQKVYLNAEVPISGWSSSAQVSDGYDGREIAASYQASSGQSITSTAVITMMGTKLYDTTNSYNTATGVYTVPSAGKYKVTGNFVTVTSTSVPNSLNIRKNSSTIFRLTPSYVNAANNYVWTGSGTIDANAGDTIDFQILAGGAGTFYNSGADNWFTIEKLQSPTTISATEVVAASYRISADKTPSASNPIDYDTKIFDTHNAVTTGSAWKFTAPYPGLYRVTTTNGTSTTGGTLDLYVNGSQDRGMMSMADTSVRSASATVELLAGGYISINPDSASKTFTGTKNNTIYIERIK